MENKFIALSLLFIAFLIGLTFFIVNMENKKREREEISVMKYTEECFKNNGKIEQIGKWYTQNYLVCNKK